MKVYLVQHGEAATKDVAPERPLTETGQFDVQRVAATLKQAGVEVDRVIHSGKLRARQTAEILAEALAPRSQPEVSDLINPNDDPAIFAAQVNDWHGDTLVVGHLPFMARLVAYLVAGDAERSLVIYQPGSVVCLETFDARSWQINWLLRPELLKSPV